MSDSKVKKTLLHDDSNLVKIPLRNPCEVQWTRPLKTLTAVKQKFGLEMEFLIYEKDSLLPIGIRPNGRQTQEFLLKLNERIKDSVLKTDAATQVLVALSLPSGANFSIEPGGQLEFSSAPQEHFDVLVEECKSALELVETCFPGEFLFFSHGTNPLATADMRLQVPKWRYLALSNYFDSETNGRGLHMSRQTCTVQPNLDVVGTEKWDEAVRIAYLVTPFARHIFANSLFFQGRPSDFLSERQEIWRHTDRARSGIPKGLLTAVDPACTYSKWAMKAPVMFIEGLEISEQPKCGELTFDSWLNDGFKGTSPCVQQWESHISTLFPEIRLRGFLEVRCTDAQPFAQTLAPIAFWTGILQSETARQGVRELQKKIDVFLKNATSKTSTSLQTLVDEDVHDHDVFKDTNYWKELTQLAKVGLKDLESDKSALQALEFFESYLATKPKPESLKSLGAHEFVRRYATAKPSAEWLQFSKA